MERNIYQNVIVPYNILRPRYSVLVICTCWQRVFRLFWLVVAVHWVTWRVTWWTVCSFRSPADRHPHCVTYSELITIIPTLSQYVSLSHHTKHCTAYIISLTSVLSALSGINHLANWQKSTKLQRDRLCTKNNIVPYISIAHNESKPLLSLCALTWLLCARSRPIKHNNTTPLSRFLFFWNFTIGQPGSNMFSRISQNCEKVFRLNFLYGQGAHPTLFWNKQRGRGVSRWNLAPLALAPRNWWRRRQAPPRLRPRRVYTSLWTGSWNERTFSFTKHACFCLS